jgi:hypothetical protein
MRICVRGLRRGATDPRSFWAASRQSLSTCVRKIMYGELYFDGVSEDLLRHRSMRRKSKALRPNSQGPTRPLVASLRQPRTHALSLLHHGDLLVFAGALQPVL